MFDGYGRKSLRLKDWDYRTPGYYFVTICTHKRYPIFAHKRYHEIAHNCWAQIPVKPSAKHVAPDEWVIMPDHVHGIFNIVEFPEGYDTALAKKGKLMPGSAGVLVSNFKMLVTKWLKAVTNMQDVDIKVWQRGYCDSIIRSEAHLNNVRRYIRENPIRYREKRDNLETLLKKMRFVDGR